MSYREKVTITKTGKLASDVYEMWFSSAAMAAEAKPGQFVSVYSNDGSRLLPRPISICRIRGNEIRLVYRVVGKGTAEFSAMQAGERLDVQGPLGNGYEAHGTRAILLGGGIGIPPMLELAASLDCPRTIVLGYRDELFLQEEFRQFGEVILATEDGSAGIRGNVLDAVRACHVTGDVLYACGPTPMLRAVRQYAIDQDLEAYISLEERMACGIGACLACVCKTAKKDAHSQVNNTRICKEGPVFPVREVEL